jgi:pimeloyl-ACP methyl ester carboxylesterase
VVFFATAISSDSGIISGISDNVSWIADLKKWAVVDPGEELLQGPRITQDPNSLVTKGRLVSGVAADGISQVVVRVLTGSASVSATVTLLDDSGAPASSADDEGALSPLAIDPLHSLLLQMPVDPVSTSKGNALLFVYRAPKEFVRPSHRSLDASLGERMVSLKVVLSDGRQEIIPLHIVRPPLILLHGTFSDSSVWAAVPVLSANSLFSVKRLSYSKDIDSHVTSTVPNYSTITRLLNPIARNVVGIDYNSPRLFDDLNNFLLDFRKGTNSSGLSVAVVQADVVAHSLGGLMARGMMRHPNFFSAATYWKGRFHKLITLGSTHLGTHQSLKLLNGANNCTRDFSRHSGAYNFTSVQIDGVSYSGAVNDQRGDGTLAGASAKIQQLHQPLPLLPDGSAPPRIPTAFLAATWDTTNASGLVDAAGAVLRTVCGDFMAQHFSSSGWPAIFDFLPNDVIVPLGSATDGQSRFSLYSGVVHGPGSVGIGTLGDFHLGFNGPSLLEDASGAPERVLDLLNTSATSSDFVLIP